MASVKNIVITKQSGVENTYYASWEFDTAAQSNSTNTNGIKRGDLVSIKSGAKYYNGVSIPSWVMNQKWYISYVNGDRAVLGQNESKTNNITSPINTKDITTGSSGSSSSGEVAANTLDYYEVKWYYDSGDKYPGTNNTVWFEDGNGGDTKQKYATYSPPDQALQFKITVKPVSKTYKDGDNDKSYWSGETKSATHKLASYHAPAEPGNLSFEIEDFKLTATVTDVEDALTDKIHFEVYDGDTKKYEGKSEVRTQRAIYECAVKAGCKYRVRCRAVALHGATEVYSEWTGFTDEKTTIPDGVSGLKAVADSKTSVKLTWTEAPTAKGYEVEYTDTKKYFDTTGGQTSSCEGTTAYITGLESGKEWFFRVRATNQNGESSWSSIVPCKIGTKPEAPTTWSLTSTAIVGEDITLYWVHNSEDGSKQTEATVYLDIGGAISQVVVPPVVLEEDEEEPTYSYTFNPKDYGNGAVIRWKVKTKGITNEYSPWSTEKEINLYAPPTVSMSLSTEEGLLSALPLAIGITAGPNTQTPLSYHVAVIANNTYESNDFTGSKTYVTAGSQVYSKILNISDSEVVMAIGAGEIILENDQSYTVTVTVSMNSGLTASQSSTFTVNWEDKAYAPNASIAIDRTTLSAYITPFCFDEFGSFVENVTLSIYRRESNGTLTEIATGVANDRITSITDPHPTLNYARYRIVAINSNTGSVSFEDLPGEPIREPAIVIQWDEDWSNYDYSNEDPAEIPPWTGSMVKLMYNVDVEESYDPDVSLVKYIGREHPVSYYGTHRGVTAKWSAVIPKTDTETLYALRRLAAWRGNVYVREPSGTGYLANVKVSMPLKHKELTIPVSFDITRVEDGAI